MKMKQGIGFISKMRDQWDAKVENGDAITAVANRMSTNIFEEVRRPVWMRVHDKFMYYNACQPIEFEYYLLKYYENL
jgi:hypothetical protein